MLLFPPTADFPRPHLPRVHSYPFDANRDAYTDFEFELDWDWIDGDDDAHICNFTDQHRVSPSGGNEDFNVVFIGAGNIMFGGC